MAHQTICQVKKCPERTHGRLADEGNTTRRDLCKGHYKSTLDFYNTDPDKPKIYEIEIWGL